MAAALALADDPEEVRRTWERSLVFVPGLEFGHFVYGELGSAVVQERLAALPVGLRYPLVIYLHDNNGITVVENRLMEEFEVENVAVILPNSFARRGREPDCGADGCRMAPEVYLARRAEMDYAVRHARQLPWVDRDNVFLVGLGEGGAAVARWGGEVEVSGYVIAGWTCSAPPEQPWLDGLRTPPERPVLLLNSRATRWSGQPGWSGRCTLRTDGHEKATAVQIDTSVHNVFALAEGRRALIAFLHAHSLR